MKSHWALLGVSITIVLLCTAAFVVVSRAESADSSSSDECSAPRSWWKPKVTFKRLGNKPVITQADSQWLYNYNTANLPIPGLPDNIFALVVRVQNLTLGSTSIYNVGPSSLATSVSYDSGATWSKISEQDVIMFPDEGQELGVEDPRIVYVDHLHTYFMFYTAVTAIPEGARAALALATNSKDPMDASAWVKRGQLFPEVGWSKSGALLVRPSAPHYLFWGDTSIFIATSDDLFTYNNTGVPLLTPRANMFDSALVESGPPPLPLSNGDFLFLYNSARVANITNPKPHWNLQYNLGYAILDRDDPSKVLHRSDEPILSPELDWETCDTMNPPRGLTPNVVFVEGWTQLADERDTFLVWYQGCDSYIGMGIVKVDLGPFANQED